MFLNYLKYKNFTKLQSDKLFYCTGISIGIIFINFIFIFINLLATGRKMRKIIAEKCRRLFFIMNYLDIILLILLSWFVFYGLFMGFIRVIGSIAGIIVGTLLATRLYLPVAEWAKDYFFGLDNLGKIVTFILLFTLINRLTSFLFSIINKTFNIIAIIPFLKTFNRLGGGILGLLQGCLVLGLMLYIISRYALISSFFGKWLIDSQIAPLLLKFVKLLSPLLPHALTMIKSLI